MPMLPSDSCIPGVDLNAVASTHVALEHLHNSSRSCCRRSGRPQQPSSPEPEPSSEEEEREAPEVTWRRRLAAEAAMDGREPTFAAGVGLLVAHSSLIACSATFMPSRNIQR